MGQEDGEDGDGVDEASDEQCGEDGEQEKE